MHSTDFDSIELGPPLKKEVEARQLQESTRAQLPSVIETTAEDGATSSKASFSIGTPWILPAVVTLPYALAHLSWPGALLLLLGGAVVVWYVADSLPFNPKQHDRSPVLQSFRWAFEYTLLTVGAVILGVLAQQIQYDGTDADVWTLTSWISLSGTALLLFSLLPFHHWYAVSLWTAMVGLVLLVVALSQAIADREDNTAVGSSVLDSFTSLGIVAFAVAGPFVASQEEQQQSHARLCYAAIILCYVVLAVLGYAAFGRTVSIVVIDDLRYFTSLGLVQWTRIFIWIHLASLGTEMLQRNLYLERRILIVVTCTFSAVALPYIGEWIALAGAMSLTPWIWMLWHHDPVDHPEWKRGVRWSVLTILVVVGALAVIGAIDGMVHNASSYRFF